MSEYSEKRARFEKWHNEFYGPQDKYNQIRSLDHADEEIGLGYLDPTVQAQFCAFEGALQLRAVLAQEAGKCEPIYQVAAKLDSTKSAWIDVDKESFDDYAARGNSWLTRTLYTSPPAPVSADGLQAIQDRHEAWMAGAENGRSEAERLKAENDLLRGGMKGDYDLDAWLDWAKEASFLRTLLKGATIEFRKCSDWICREVEAGTSSATYWAIRMRKQAELIDARFDKVKELNQ